MTAMMPDKRGMIRDCNSANETLAEYRRSELVRQRWRRASGFFVQRPFSMPMSAVR